MCAQPSQTPRDRDREPLAVDVDNPLQNEPLHNEEHMTDERERKRKLASEEETQAELRNEDPLTGESGSHPVAAGAGAALGGAAAGAAAGMLGGPVGTAVGAIVGGVAGGLAGKAIGEQIDPTVETAYWREEFRHRNYVDEDGIYESYEPAYRYGWETWQDLADHNWDEIEPQLERGWPDRQGNSPLDWERARYAAHDAWLRLDEQFPQTRQSDAKRPNPR